MRIRGAVLERSGVLPPYAEHLPLTVTDLELAPPGPGEVLVRIEAAGLCHSDLSVIDGARPRPMPMLLGHEAAGRVLGKGPGVEDLVTDQRVVMAFLPRCEACPGCARGGRTPCEPGSAANAVGHLVGGGVRLSRDGEPVMHHLGVSAFATHAVVDRRSLVPVSDEVPADVAALLGCAVLTGGGAVLNSATPAPGDTLAVVGLGGVGLAALLTALALPDVTVIGIDLSADKCRVASALGAHRALEPAEAVAEGMRADVVIEAAGSARAFETAVAITGPGGRTVTVGLPAPDARASVSLAALVAEGRTMIGSYLGSGVPSRDVPTFARMWANGALPVEKLISGRIALDDVNAGMDALADGSALRQIIDLGSEDLR